MSLATNVSNLATRIATEVKAVRALSGDLASLDTTAKTNLVAAVNELVSAVNTVASNLSNLDESTASEITSIQGDLSTIFSDITSLQSDLSTLDVSGQVQALINDAATATDSVWSSSKTATEISSAVSALINGAPSILDTLKELADALGNDESALSALTTTVSGKADAIHSHVISDVTGLQAALDAKASASALSTLTANVGDTTTNYVTTFEAGLI
jgi:chromosome segregation ATPase